MTKDRAAFTTLTASGTTAILDASGAVDATLLLKSSNGTGSVTTPASFTVQVKASTGTSWYTLTTLVGSSTAAQVDDIVILIPAPVASVQVIYVAPAGPTSPSLSGELARLSL